jgi:thiosulfate/3-mercaptopyruvate sulfurtransferase
MSAPLLVDVDWLAGHLGDSQVRVFDTTVQLVRPPEGGPYQVVSGRSEYESAHIPRAGFADIAGELSADDSPFPFTVPSAERFGSAAGQLGIGEGVRVVLYAQDTPMWATRMWWLLRYFGFDDASVLDGGLPAWKAAGHGLDDQPCAYPPAGFVARPRPQLLASRQDVKAVVDGDARSCLINALLPPVFRGEGISSYSRPGRIPRSVNAPWTTMIDPETNLFRSPPELERELDAIIGLGDQPVIAYCGGGISATVDLFALALVGRYDARLYDGSLTEWSRDPALPLETG